MSKTDTMSIALVFAFAVLLIGGLAVVPSFNIHNALAETQKLKDNTDSDKNSPILELLKNGKSKKPKKHN